MKRKLALGPSWINHGFVFCHDDGQPLDPASISKVLHKALAQAGLPQVRVHDLRHTAATLHLALGENAKVVQELLGHSTIGLTMDTYSHFTPSTHAAAAKKMQALFADV